MRKYIIIVITLLLTSVAQADVLIQLAWDLNPTDYPPGLLAPGEAYGTILIKRRVWAGDMNGVDEFLSILPLTEKMRQHAIVDASQDARLACFRLHAVKYVVATGVVTAWSAPSNLATAPSGYWLCADPSTSLPAPRSFIFP